jgi:hypothetical protein
VFITLNSRELLEDIWSGSRLSPYIFEGIRPIELSTIKSIQINISFVPLLFALGVDNNITFFTSIFTSLRLYVASWVAYQSQDKPLGGLLSHGVPPQGVSDLGAIGERCRLCTHMDHPTTKRGPSSFDVEKTPLMA